MDIKNERRLQREHENRMRSDTYATIGRNVEEKMNEAEAKAWDSLGRYKFQMFGYWAAVWVHMNKIGNFKRPNPFRELVVLAKRTDK